MIRIDLGLYSQVLRRHRRLVMVGVALTMGLAFLSYVRVSPTGIGYRTNEIWTNQATVLLTQKGAPELRSVLPTTGVDGVSSYADTGRFESLVNLYAALATSDAVAAELRRDGLVTAEAIKENGLPVIASVVPDTPLLAITGKATTPSKATALTVGATKAFVDVLESRQFADKIPVKDRVQVRVVHAAGTPSLASPRRKTLLIMVLLGGLIATVAAAFTRENLSRQEPRAEAVAELRPTLAVDESAPAQDRTARGGGSRGARGVGSARDGSVDTEPVSLARPTRTLGRPPG